MLAGLLAIGLGLAGPAQGDERQTLLRGLEAQYAAALVRERRLADDRELQVLAKSEQRLRQARRRVDEAREQREQAQAELTQAREDFARFSQELGQRHAELQAQLEAFRFESGRLEQQASPDKRAALQRFADGDRLGAWPVLEALTEAELKASETALRQGQARKLRELAQLRRLMRQRGEATLAEELLWWTRAAELEPGHPSTQLTRGQLLLQLGRLQEAESLLLDLQPARAVDAGMRSMLLGQLHRERNELDLAERSLQAALQSCREEGGAGRDLADAIASQALASLLRVAQARGRYDSSQEYARQQLALAQQIAQRRPGHEAPAFGVARALLDLAAERRQQEDPQALGAVLEQAERFLQQALRAHPDSVRLRAAQARHLANQGQWHWLRTEPGQARRLFLQSQQQFAALAAEDPGNTHWVHEEAMARQRLGKLLEDLGEWHEARDHYQQALQAVNRLAADQPEVLLARQFQAVHAAQLAQLALRLDDLPLAQRSLEAALAHFEAVQRQQPDDLQNRYSHLSALLLHGDLLQRSQAGTAALAVLQRVQQSALALSASPLPAQLVVKLCEGATRRLAALSEGGAAWRTLLDWAAQAPAAVLQESHWAELLKRAREQAATAAQP